MAVGWDNGTRLVTILRFPLETVTSEPVPTWYIFWYEIKLGRRKVQAFSKSAISYLESSMCDSYRLLAYGQSSTRFKKKYVSGYAHWSNPAA